ncbi:hypothetical protein KIN20_024468 [Parelaphostrongylus tenuis]|uniref:Uncharacterized protein n=1 Tax=Parelaphostrongylus tenuis TaxID=148309 RepID=A0AAD5NCU8_PARTN|nr:hypothetical protein KIN20_024468 [Parelaphostrongylus tenuis]
MRVKHSFRFFCYSAVWRPSWKANTGAERKFPSFKIYSYTQTTTTTTTTILQNRGHNYPTLFAIGPPSFGSDRSTTPSALHQRILDMLRLHRKIQIGDLQKSVALVGKRRSQT